MLTKNSLLSFLLLLALLSTGTIGCGVYSFTDASVPEGIKTIRVNFLDNKARYVNPQLSPQLTDRLRQKIVNQTRLTQTNSDNVDWDVTGAITEYSVTTSAISSNQPGGTGGQRQAAVTNRLTVTVQLTVNDRTKNTSQDVSVSRSFEFDANKTLQAVEAELLDQIIRNMADDMFNRMFSNW